MVAWFLSVIVISIEHLHPALPITQERTQTVSIAFKVTLNGAVFIPAFFKVNQAARISAMQSSESPHDYPANVWFYSPLKGPLEI